MSSGHSSLARSAAKLLLATLLVAAALASYGLLRPTSVIAQAVENHVFDGHWYSPEWRYG